MNRDDIRKELQQPGAQELLKRPMLGLAYNGLDGTPRVIPIGFLCKQGRVVICTSTTSPKVKALRDRPQVALTVDVGGTPSDAKSLLIRGVANLEVVDGIPEEYLEAAARTMDGEDLAAFTTNVTATYDQMVRIAIVPTWVRFYDFGAGRLPRTLQELVEKASVG